jgi:uncharacterized protein (DUF1330 family)
LAETKESKNMPAYLVYICQGVSDRDELETYWEKAPATFEGHDVKLLSAYTPLVHLEGDGPVEGVVIAEFPSVDDAKDWYNGAYQDVMPHRVRGAKYLGLIVDGGVTVNVDERMPQTRTSLT